MQRRAGFREAADIRIAPYRDDSSFTDGKGLVDGKARIDRNHFPVMENGVGVRLLGKQRRAKGHENRDSDEQRRRHHGGVLEH
jgi:hypothetical protein